MRGVFRVRGKGWCSSIMAKIFPYVSPIFCSQMLYMYFEVLCLKSDLHLGNLCDFPANKSVNPIRFRKAKYVE